MEGVSAVSVDDVLAEASARLADYKVPERLVIVCDIPRNALGKIDRRLALTMFSEQDRRLAVEGELTR
jgi:long-chain acyl-CoA synthetase